MERRKACNSEDSDGYPERTFVHALVLLGTNGVSYKHIQSDADEPEHISIECRKFQPAIICNAFVGAGNPAEPIMSDNDHTDMPFVWI